MRILIATDTFGGVVVVLVILLLSSGRGGSGAAVAVLAAVAAVLFVVAASVTALIVWRVRHPEPVVRLQPPVLAEPVPGRAAIEGPRTVNNFFGVDAGQVAEILRRQQEGLSGGPV